MLLLWSTRKPTTMGCFSAWLKNWICCGRPSSSTRKSLATRLETNFPLLSVTVTGTMTSVVVLVNVGWPCGAAGVAGVGGGVCGSALQDKSSVHVEAAANRKSRDMTSWFYSTATGATEQGSVLNAEKSNVSSAFSAPLSPATRDDRVADSSNRASPLEAACRPAKGSALKRQPRVTASFRPARGRWQTWGFPRRGYWPGWGRCR